MRILYVSTLYPPEIVGGAEKVVQRVAEGLVKLGHECHVVTLGHSRVLERRVLNGVVVHEVPMKNIYRPFGRRRPSAGYRLAWHTLDSFNVRMARVVGRVLDSVTPDIVNTHNIAGFSVAVWRVIKNRNLPLVHTLHDQYLLCPRTTMFRCGRNCTRQCKGCAVYSLPRIRATRLPDMVTGVSRFIIDRHRCFGCFVGVQERIIYNAYEKPARPTSYRTDRTDSRLRFGYLGRLHESKGVEELIRAWHELPQNEALLLVAGTGEQTYVERLRRMTEDRVDVRWLGFIRPESLLANIDIMVIPSLWHDTAPLVALEAQAWGVPVIAANRGGLPELIAGGASWIFDPERHGQLSSVLQALIAHRGATQEESNAAMAKAASFSFLAQIRGYLEAYRAVMGVPQK